MFEFHGSATIRDSAGCDDLEDDPSPVTVAVVEELAAAVAGTNRVADVRWQNGQLHVWLSGFYNHRSDEVVELFTAVARRAPGSYGILHVHYDEDPAYPNSWTRFVMRRGRVRAEHEAALSPHIGLVEDDCTDPT